MLHARHSFIKSYNDFRFFRCILMKPNRRTILKLSIITGAVLLAFALFSPLGKYFLERYDKDLLGRKLTIDWAFVNPLTGYVFLSNATVYEAQGDSIFMRAQNVHGRFSMLNLLRRRAIISNLTFEKPDVRIVQNKHEYNFDDLVKLLTPDKSHIRSSPWIAELVNVKIVDGKFFFIDKIIPINYFVKEVNVESQGYLNQGDTIAATLSLASGIGSGTLEGNITINTERLDYRFDVDVRNFNMEIIRQYIWELINYGMFTAHVDARMKGRGNFQSRESIETSGRLSIRDFHLGKTTTDDYASFKKLVFVVSDLSPLKHKFLFDSVLLVQPLLKYERYDSLDNVETLFGKKGSNISDITRQQGRFNLVIELARYIKVLSQNFFKSDYKINRMEVTNGNFAFNDFSLTESFSMNAKPFHLVADSVNANDKRVKVSIASGINPFGKLSIDLSINPRDSGDFDMGLHLQNIPAALFNPYLISFTSFPLDRGTLAIKSAWKVRNGQIASTNHLIVVDPRVSKRLRNKDTHWVPMPLIMALIRERGNVIDYDIPITGNLKDPKFHLRDVIFDIVKNIFVKPPTTPYRQEIRNLETEIETALTIKWEMRQRSFRSEQAKFVDHLSDFLQENPTATIGAFPRSFGDKEKEYILFYETKKRFFQLTHGNVKQISPQDSMAIEKMSVRDPALVRHISKGLSDTIMFTLQEKCINFVGSAIVRKEFNELVHERNRAFLSFFQENKTEERITLHKTLNDVPYNGFSNIRLKYDGVIPGGLKRAYARMLELNDEAPRKKYLEYRKLEAAQVTDR